MNVSQIHVKMTDAVLDVTLVEDSTARVPQDLEEHYVKVKLTYY